MRSVTRSMMSRPLPSHQKLAEKFVILNNRLDGMITRIYNIKKACGDQRSKPSFLTDKSLESGVKFVVRKFPAIDTRNHQNQLAAINTAKTEILKGLSIYYYTFVDVMEFKDEVNEILTIVDSLGVYFDITLCYDLTANYLDLIVKYVSLFVLMSRIEERKAIIGLYNHAHDMLQGKTDKDFPRLAQLIQDYESNPLKKLVEDFSVHQRSIHQALMSMMQVYPHRNLSADDWRTGSLFSIISTPAIMLNPALTDKMPCEYLSMERMEKWIYFGYLLCHGSLLSNAEATQNLWKPVLQGNFCISLFRDEILMIHRTTEEIFSGLKGYNKKVAEVRECRDIAAQQAGKNHADKRKFLRSAMKELTMLITDQPGLLGPKTLFVFMSLAYARDEVLWIVRHAGNLLKKANPEDFVDRYLAELIFYMEEMRQLVRSYDEVIQRYYVQYLYGYDAIVLNETVQNLSVCPEDESVIMTSVVNTMTSLSIKQVEQKELFDFRGMRLDWFRLQAYTCVSKAALLLKDNQQLGKLMNSIMFHCRMVDDLDEMLNETSDLSDLCFFPTILATSFKRSLELHSRYSIAFPLICGHFQNAISDFCPEERLHIKDRAMNYVTTFLDDMSKDARNLIFSIADEQCILSDQVLPKNAGAHLKLGARKKPKGKKNAKLQDTETKKPGVESLRKDILHVTKMDKYHNALAEICTAINYRQTFAVWDHTFSPKEFLAAQIESRFAKQLVALAYNKETNEVAKPTELLSRTRTYMATLQRMENYVQLDVSKIFNSVLLQQTQSVDSKGENTITTIYTQWYLDVLLRQVSNGNSIVFSEIRKSFIQVPGNESSSSNNQLTINPEEFSNTTELRALADLIGPYGMKNFNENLAWHVASQINELKKSVIQNRETLSVLRSNFDKPEQMVVHYRRLEGAETVLLRMTIIGVILYFRAATQDALNDVLQRRIPFLLSSITDFKEHIPKETEIKVSITINELASAAGIRCDVDPALCQALASATKNESPEEEHKLACLLMVFLAVSIPVLARDEGSIFLPEFGAHQNSCHCIAFAVNRVAAALFTVTKGNIQERLTEFLALASSSLLKLGLETDRASTRNRDSVYLLLEQIVKDSPVLTMDLLESCFPYVLLRNSYHAVRVQSAKANAAGQTSPNPQSTDASANP